MVYILQDASSFCQTSIIHACSTPRLHMDNVFMLGCNSIGLTNHRLYGILAFDRQKNNALGKFAKGRLKWKDKVLRERKSG